MLAMLVQQQGRSRESVHRSVQPVAICTAAAAAAAAALLLGMSKVSPPKGKHSTPGKDLRYRNMA